MIIKWKDPLFCVVGKKQRHMLAHCWQDCGCCWEGTQDSHPGKWSGGVIKSYTLAHR